MKLEICCTNLQSALAAEKGGADRIEICSALQLGGITPSYSLIKQVKEALQIPVHVLIRPREGNFIYDAHEQNIMLNDILVCKSLGIDGIVTGCLNNQLEIDIATFKTFIVAAKGLEFTFHRSFDLVKDPMKSLDSLIELKVTRLLSSGQKETAEKGRILLKQLVEASENQMEIMAGSGINSGNATELIQFTKVNAIHASAKKEIASLTENRLKGLTEGHFVVDEEEVRRLKNQCDNLII